jgi:hypothetical protein
MGASAADLLFVIHSLSFADLLFVTDSITITDLLFLVDSSLKTVEKRNERSRKEDERNGTN